MTLNIHKNSTCTGPGTRFAARRQELGLAANYRDEKKGLREWLETVVAR